MRASSTGVYTGVDDNGAVFKEPPLVDVHRDEVLRPVEKVLNVEIHPRFDELMRLIIA